MQNHPLDARLTWNVTRLRGSTQTVSFVIRKVHRGVSQQSWRVILGKHKKQSHSYTFCIYPHKNWCRLCSCCNQYLFVFVNSLVLFMTMLIWRVLRRHSAIKSEIVFSEEVFRGILSWKSNIERRLPTLHSRLMTDTKALFRNIPHIKWKLMTNYSVYCWSLDDEKLVLTVA